MTKPAKIDERQLQGQAIGLPLVEIRLYDNFGNDIPLDGKSELLFTLKRQIAEVKHRPRRSASHSASSCAKWAPATSIYNSTSDIVTLSQCIMLSPRTRGLQNVTVNSTENAVRIDVTFEIHVSYIVRLQIGKPPTQTEYNASIVVSNSTSFAMDNNTYVQSSLSGGRLGIFLAPGIATVNVFTTVELEGMSHLQ